MKCEEINSSEVRCQTSTNLLSHVMVQARVIFLSFPQNLVSLLYWTQNRSLLTTLHSTPTVPYWQHYTVHPQVLTDILYWYYRAWRWMGPCYSGHWRRIWFPKRGLGTLHFKLWSDILYWWIFLLFRPYLRISRLQHWWIW